MRKNLDSYFMEYFQLLFNIEGFPPRWQCGSAWTELLGWTHILSDTIISISYFSIPFTMIFFIFKRNDFPFHSIIYLFISFIFFCGLGHLVEAIIFWHPIYRFSGLIKALTALVSFTTAVFLIYYIPKILSIPKYAEIKSTLASIVESSHDAILSFNDKAQVTTINDTARALLESYLDKNEGVEGVIKKIIPSFSTFESFLSELKNQKIEINDEILIYKGNQKKYYLSTISPIYSPENTFSGGSIILKDITKEKETKIALEKAYEELESFSYSASHDLKQPIRGIQHYAYFLKMDHEDSLNSDALEKIETILSLSKRMNNQLDSLLHLSRVGFKSLKKESIDIKELLDVVEKMLQPIICSKKATLKSDEYFPNFFGNKVFFFQIFENLITNALKYNQSTRPIIEIGFLKEKKSDGYLYQNVLYVKDNGIGIDEKFHNSIFDLFKRLHRRTKYGGGNGAGLTIVKKIIEAHQGHIWLESKPGKGTVFYFTVEEAKLCQDQK